MMIRIDHNKYAGVNGWYISRGGSYLRRDGTWHPAMSMAWDTQSGTYFASRDEAKVCLAEHGLREGQQPDQHR